MFFKRKTIEDLAKPNGVLGKPSIADRRGLFKIGAIDNDPFQALESLQDAGFDIVFLGNTTNLKVISKYDILLCDVGGVAEELNAKEQGAALIQEIKRVYPAKQVVVYSGLHGRTQALKLARERADAYLTKGSDIDIWIQSLDRIIDKISDPAYQWKIACSSLSDAGLTHEQIAKLEDKYTRAILKQDKSIFEKSIAAINLSDTTRGVLTGLLSSAIWTLILAA